jgi:hypothetical protein
LNTLSTPNAALPIIHLLSSGGFYGAERMLLDHCLATPGQHQVLFLDAPPALIATLMGGLAKLPRMAGH